jgi:hypothetical protein
MTLFVPAKWLVLRADSIYSLNKMRIPLIIIKPLIGQQNKKEKNILFILFKLEKALTMKVLQLFH